MMTTKKCVMDTVSDLVGELMYYGRKEDEDLPRGEIERMVESGELTIEEIVAKFESRLREVL